jgi:hypothetical protein
VSAFLVALGLAVVFVAGSVFAMQPSPRQRQLAALRQAAVLAGLRVRVRPGEPRVDYVLAWRSDDLDGTRATDFVADRAGGGEWSLARRSGPSEQALREALAGLPAGVDRVSGGADGLVASWQERGDAAAAQSVARVLARLREACRAAG